MNVSLFDEYDELPEGFLTATPENLHRHVPRPAVIRLPGSVNVLKDAVSRGQHSWFAVDALEAVGDQAQAAVHAALFVIGHAGARDGLRQWWRGPP